MASKTIMTQFVFSCTSPSAATSLSPASIHSSKETQSFFIAAGSLSVNHQIDCFILLVSRDYFDTSSLIGFDGVVALLKLLIPKSPSGRIYVSQHASKSLFLLTFPYSA